MEKNLNKKYLMVKGARQVGKTFFVDKFCRENYKSDIYINFFENGLDVEIIIKQITIRILNVHFVTHHDFSPVLQIQRTILEDYKMDIGKYVKETEKAKVRE